MKIIVTHLSPDLDAITACWLIQRFLPDWKDARIKFIPAGSTLDNHPVDSDKNIIHVDTGLGKFDHHQTDDSISATKLVFEFLVKHNYIEMKNREALERIVNFVTDIDHFQEVNFPDAIDDRYDFCLHQIADNLKSSFKDGNELIEYIGLILDAEFSLFKKKINAEKEIKKGLIFRSKYGRCLAILTNNEEAVKLALKMGFVLVIRKDPVKGNARIKTLPDKKYDLTPVYNAVSRVDPKAGWFLHISKNMLLNGSSKNPTLIPTSLSLQKLIEIIKNI